MHAWHGKREKTDIEQQHVQQKATWAPARYKVVVLPG